MYMLSKIKIYQFYRCFSTLSSKNTDIALKQFFKKDRNSRKKKKNIKNKNETKSKNFKELYKSCAYNDRED